MKKDFLEVLRKAFYTFIKTNPLTKRNPKFMYNFLSTVISCPLVLIPLNLILSIDMSAKKSAYDYFNYSKEEIEKTLSQLSDEQSRKAYNQIIKYRSTFAPFSLFGKTRDSVKYQYIDPVILPVHKDETFIDVGAFLGESSENVFNFFNEQCDSEFEFVTMLVEPDETNYYNMKKLLSGVSYKTISECCAAGDVNGCEGFDPGLFASCKINKISKQTVEQKTIDSLCEKYGLKPTYIKYDVEGFEIFALNGSEKTISDYRPRLAVSIYHSNTDFVEIPKLIREKYSFYDMYVRHYSGFFADTVLYCIPSKNSN